MIAEQQLSVSSIDELQHFVHRTLCARENLLEDQFHTHTLELLSRGQACGLQFSLHGPRSIRLGAIWALAQNVIYFYDTRGERFLKVALSRRIMHAQRASA